MTSGSGFVKWLFPLLLTDERECGLKDIIPQLELILFEKVTGLGVKYFELSVGFEAYSMMRFIHLNDTKTPVWNMQVLTNMQAKALDYSDAVLFHQDYEMM